MTIPADALDEYDKLWARVEAISAVSYPPRITTWLVSRDGALHVGQCCECDIVTQGKTLAELRERAAHLLRTTEYLRATHRGGSIPKPYPPAFVKRISGTHVVCPALGPIPILSRFKLPWPVKRPTARKQTFVVNPDLYCPPTGAKS